MHTLKQPLLGISTVSMNDRHHHYSQVYQQVKNPFPTFIVPTMKGTKVEKPTLPFNKKLMEKAEGFTSRFDFNMHVSFARSCGKRYRKPPILRLRAIDALLQGICYHYDPLANRVNATLTTIAIECGLATESKNGNLAITRATRALQSLAKDFGFLTYSDPEFDPSIGCNIPTDITFTPAFFDALGISESAVAAARKGRAEWKNKEREEKGLERLGIGELIKQAWQAFHKRFKEYRLTRKAHGEKRARARRDAKLSHQEIKSRVHRELTRELALGLFPADRHAVIEEVKRRVRERMIMSRGNRTTRLTLTPVLT